MGVIMRAKLLTALLLAIGAIGSPASAATVDYYISGDGAGAFVFGDWAGPFTIKLVGDNSTVQNESGASVIDPLESASVTLDGSFIATLLIATRLGLASNLISFSRAGISGAGLFDFFLSPSDAAAFHFQAGYGPVTGTGVFTLDQFTDVPAHYQFMTGFTADGPFALFTSSDVQFWSTGVPESST